jgi:hypothetical protein
MTSYWTGSVGLIGAGSQAGITCVTRRDKQQSLDSVPFRNCVVSLRKSSALQTVVFKSYDTQLLSLVAMLRQLAWEHRPLSDG